MNSSDEWYPLRLGAPDEHGARTWRCDNHWRSNGDKHAIANKAWSPAELLATLARHMERYHPDRDVLAEIAAAGGIR